MLAKNFKKALAGFLSFVMLFTLVGGNWITLAAANDQIAHQGETVVSEDGKVSLQKTIRQTGKDAFEITLTVDTEDKVTSYVQDASVDVVLVIDISNSMTSNRLSSAKDAAETFVETMLSEEVVTDSRIAVATYNNSGHTIKSLSNNKSELISAIRSINLDSDTNNGGTNIQAGIQKAQSLLSSGENENQFIVLLSDGVPTYSYQGTEAENSALIPKADGGNYGFRITQFNTTRVGSGSSHNLGDKRQYSIGRKTVKDNVLPTLSQALLAKESGIEIYSVLFMDKKDDSYKVASHVMKNTASDADHYIGTDKLEELAGIFKGFSEEILEKTKVWQVVDPMGDFIRWGDFTVSVPSSAASFNAQTNTLTWNMWHKSVIPQTIGENKYRYTLKYNITLDTAAQGFVESREYDTNGTTTLTYFIGEELTDESQLETIDFDVPSVIGTIPVLDYSVEYYTWNGSRYVRTDDNYRNTAKLWSTISAPAGYETKYEAENYEYNAAVSEPSALFIEDGQVLKLYYDRIATRVTVNHHYTTHIVTENGTSSVTLDPVQETPQGIFYVGDEYSATRRTQNNSFTFVKAEPSEIITLTRDPSDNVIDLYYEKTVDERAEASVQVVHHYKTKTWTVENGQSVLKESGYDEDGVYQTGFKAGQSYTATPVPKDFERTSPDDELTISHLSGGKNVIDIYYEKTVDTRVPTQVEVYHHYTTNTTSIGDNGETVMTPSTQITGPIRPEGPFYVNESFTAMPVPNGFTQTTADAALTITLKENGNRIDIYYEKNVDERVPANVTVNHHYTTYTTYIDANGHQQTRESDSSSTVTPEGPFYKGQSFTATPIPNGFAQITDSADLTVILNAGSNTINIEYIKYVYPDEAKVTVYHHYTTYTTTIDGVTSSTQDVTGVSYTGYVGESYTAVAVPDGFEQVTKEDDLTIRMEAGDNAIHIDYEKTVDHRVPTTVQVYHRYTTKTWIIENGQSVLKTGTPIVTGPVSPSETLYVGQRFTAVAVPNGFTQVTPEDELTITLKQEGNRITIDYEKVEDARVSAAVEVYHHYKTYTKSIVDGKVTTSETVLDVDGVKLPMYAGQSYTATPEPNGFSVVTDAADLTIQPLKDGVNRIDIYYEKTMDLTREATVVVHHIYTTHDLAGGDPVVFTQDDALVNSFSGLSFTATQNTLDDLYEMTGVDPSLTIVLQEGANEITIDYERTIDSRISTDVTVRHQYVTYDVGTDTRTMDQELIETFSGRENGIYVGATFAAVPKPKDDYAMESISAESIVLAESGNSITIVYVLAVEDIEDEETPLSPPTDPDDGEDIYDEEVPLVESPQTGENRSWPLQIAAVFAAAGLVVFTFKRRDKKERPGE